MDRGKAFGCDRTKAETIFYHKTMHLLHGRRTRDIRDMLHLHLAKPFNQHHCNSPALTLHLSHINETNGFKPVAKGHGH